MILIGDPLQLRPSLANFSERLTRLYYQQTLMTLVWQSSRWTILVQAISIALTNL